MSYSVEQLCDDVERLIKMERASTYTPAEIDALEDAAISIRKNMETTSYAASIPYIFIECTGNIDFGEIMPGSRDWILDDAEKAIAEIRAHGLQEPPVPSQQRPWWNKIF